MNFEEWVAFLEPTAHKAGAMCESVDAWNDKKTALENACRIMGKRCTFELKKAISGLRNQARSLQ